MSKAKRTTIAVKGASVAVLSKEHQDFISLTDIARYKDPERTDYLISNWLRNRNTIELLPENPDFEPIVVTSGETDFVIEGLAVGLIRNNMMM